MKLNCIHFIQGCSGCVISEQMEHPPIFDDATLYFKEKLNFDFPIQYGELKGWRARAKLVVRGTASQPIIGLYKGGTHEAIDIPFCQVQYTAINQAASLISEWIKENEIPPYIELTGKGTLRYLQLSVENSTGLVQVVLILNAPLDETVLQALWNKGEGLFHSLWVNYNTVRTNSIWGTEWQKAFGEKWFKVTLQNHDYLLHPAAFMQANPEMYEALLNDLSREILPNKKVVEFYAGVGIIGLSILSKSSQLILSELNRTGKLCFKENLKYFPTEEQQKATYHELDANKGAAFLSEGQVVIVDPPRKGIDPSLFEKILSSTTLQQFIYVSCGWTSFKKEAEILIQNGFTLTYAKGYLFFPGTNQIETLAIFTRS